MMLLTVPESLSPRREWLLRWDVYTSHLEPGTETMEGIVEEEDQWQARALSGSVKAYGETEDAALVALALVLKVPLWNEEASVAEMERRNVLRESAQVELPN